jgi:uncharacterized membrane protein (DUF2068 family)
MEPSRPLGLFLIGLFKLGKAILFAALGIGMLRLINRDIDGIFLELIKRVHIDAEHQFIQNILWQLSLIDNHRLHEISTVSFVFALLLMIESFGLLWQKVWAEFMTVAETALFIPFEIYEIIRHATITKVAIIGINVAIVIYLMWAIARKSSTKKALMQHPLNL